MDNILHAFCFYAAAALWAQWNWNEFEIAIKVIKNLQITRLWVLCLPFGLGRYMQARFNELEGGKPEGYTKFCNKFYELETDQGSRMLHSCTMLCIFLG